MRVQQSINQSATIFGSLTFHILTLLRFIQFVFALKPN